MTIIGSISPCQGVAIFWRMPRSKLAFHADMQRYPDETLSSVAARFQTMFPLDRIVSIRDRTGRFQAFK